MKLTGARFSAILFVIAIVGFVGCKKDKKYIPVTQTVTVTNTVTIQHYYYDVELADPSGILGYLYDNFDNSFMGEHYGGIYVGSNDLGGFPMGNAMDLGYLSFDLSSLGQPGNAVLTDVTLHLYGCSALASVLNISVTLPGPPTGNTAEMIDNIYAGTLLAQQAVQAAGDYFITINPADVILDSGVLYLGLYSDATFENPLEAVFDENDAYISVEYVVQE